MFLLISWDSQFGEPSDQKRGPRSSSFWLPRNLSHHMDRQAHTGDTVLVERERWQVGAKHCQRRQKTKYIGPVASHFRKGGGEGGIKGAARLRAAYMCNWNIFGENIARFTASLTLTLPLPPGLTLCTAFRQNRVQIPARLPHWGTKKTKEKN